MTVLLILLSACWMLPAGAHTYDGSTNPESSDEEPLSIILMIGDGMGPEHVRLGKWVEVGPNGSLLMEQLPFSANVTTYSADSNITDSSAAATAIASGVKINNSFVGIDPNGVVLETIIDVAQAFGKATGVLSKTTIQHGTPAAFMTHVVNRNSYQEITRQIIEEAGIDVLLGGGSRYFNTSEIDAMVDNGYSFVQDRDELLAVASGKVLGLFSYDHMPYEQVRDYDESPSLSEMVEKSIEILSQDPQGFFLLAEGGKIDHAAHAHDQINTALETIAFDKAVGTALEYVNSHPNTILIVNADHETGGLAILGQNLNETLPSSTNEESVNRQLRIERANNITVDWSTTYHTATDVPLYWKGDIFNESVHSVDNTDIFTAMYTYFMSSPPTTSTTTTTTDDIITEPPPPLFIPVIATLFVVTAVVILYVRRAQ
jgi:alkaline phosphatase